MRYCYSFIARYGIWMMIILLFLFLFIFVASIAANVSIVGVKAYALQSDFRPFYTGGLMMLHGVRNNFYILSTQFSWQKQLVPQLSSTKQLMPFLNPPFAALLFAPFAFLPFLPAYALWLFCNLLLLCILITVIYKLFPQQTWQEKLFLALVVITYLPIISNLVQAQLAYVVTGAFLFSYIFFLKNKNFVGGLLLSFVCIKPQYILFPLLYLLWKKQKRIYLGFFVGLIFFFVASYALVGMEGMRSYFVFLTTITNGHGLTIPHDANPTVEGFLLAIMPQKNILPIWIFLETVLIALCVYVCRKQVQVQEKEFQFQWAVIIITTILASVHTNFHDLSMLIVAGVLMIKWGQGKNTKRRILITTLVLGGYIVAFLSPFIFKLSHIQLYVPYLCLVLLLITGIQEYERKHIVVTPM